MAEDKTPDTETGLQEETGNLAREDNLIREERAEPVANPNAEDVIEAFGGIRPMASKLGIAVSTVQGWKVRNHIPGNRWRDIISAAAANQIELDMVLNKSAPEAQQSEAQQSEAQQLEDRQLEDRQPEDGQKEDRTETVKETLETDVKGGEEDFPETSPTSEAPPPPPESRSESSSAPPSATPSSSGDGLALLVGVMALAAVALRPVWGPYIDPYIAQYFPVAADQTMVSAAPALETGADLKALEDRLVALETRSVTESPVLSETAFIIPPELLERIAGLEEELEAIRASAEALKMAEKEASTILAETRSALQAASERDQATRQRLVERMGVLESMVARISEEAERATSRIAGAEQRIARQDEEIATLEARPALQGARQAGIALAVGDVETALSGGRPFAAAMDRIMGLTGNIGPVAEAAALLKPYAKSGVVSRVSLITDYKSLVPVIQAELGQVDGDLEETFLGAVQSLISIRRKGEEPNAPPVSRAEAALDRGDLAGAIAALTPQADQSAALKSWIQGAEARLAAESALSALRNAVALDLTPTSSSGEGDSDKGGDES